MAEPLKIKGIVVRCANLGDNDKMLTLLTRERGVISVCARGVKSLKNKNAQSAMPLCYSDFVLNEKGEVFSLVSADIIESFYNLRENVEALSYGIYFSQLAAYTVGKNNLADEEMKLLLNTLYLLCKDMTRCDVLKCVFELKICEYAGIAPYMESCMCGEEGMYFDVLTGEMVCSVHKTQSCRKISDGAKKVCRYVQNADLKTALTFDTPKIIADEISELVEEFMTNQLGKLPKSLEFVKKLY